MRGKFLHEYNKASVRSYNMVSRVFLCGKSVEDIEIILEKTW